MFDIKKFFALRPTFFLIGFFNVIIFHIAIMRLWFFLYDSSNRLEVGSMPLALLINSLLVVFFCWPHSFLLSPRVKTVLLKYIPQKLYPTIYGLHASIGIILMDNYWCDLGGNIYYLQGNMKALFDVLYTLSWLFMLWSMIATGLFRQSGIESWWKALKGQKMSYSLLSSGPYSICRHPIYAAFLAMIWTTPNMSFDRMFLALTWTFYIFAGAKIKESRLMKNRAYQTYAQTVPSFPFLPARVDQFITETIWRIQIL
jgi:methanethiol S-methyltransferase